MSIARYLSKFAALLGSDGKVPATGIATGGVPSFDGIKFPATQVASSDANTLDDYEEGTWTPVVKLGTTTLTAANNVCVYTKIGRVVILYAEVYNIIKAGSGDLTISGLPFSCAAQYGVPGDSRWGGINTGGKLTPLLGVGSTSMGFQNYNSTSGYAGSTADVHVSSTFHLYNVSLIYFTS